MNTMNYKLQKKAFCTGLLIIFGFVSSPVAANKVPTVSVEKAITSEMILRTPVTGTLVPKQEILVNTQISGLTIEKIFVEAGDTVKRGQVLLSLDVSLHKAQLTQAVNSKLQAEAGKRQALNQVQSATANLQQAQASLERAQKLKRSGNISQASLESAQTAQANANAQLDSAKDGLEVANAQVEVAITQLKLAKMNLERTKIKAKVAGVVAQRNAQIGAIAMASGLPLFTIIQDSEIEVEVEIIETALGLVSIGDTADFEIAGVGIVEAKVRLISPSVNPQTRLGTIKMSLVKNPNIRIGLFASGWIVMDVYQTTMVPIKSVISDAKGDFVQTLVNNKIERRYIQAGQVWQGNREVISGLKSGEIVLSRAGAFFQDGDEVKPLFSEGKTK